jgi:hypothetical protein
VNVAAILRSGLPSNLGPRLSAAAVTELRVLTSELSSLELRDNPDFRNSRLTNKKLSIKSFYANYFRHLQTDELAVGI